MASAHRSGFRAQPARHSVRGLQRQNLCFEGRTVSLAGPVLTCGLLDVDARTDGRLKLGGDVVVATVPSLGAKVGVLIGDKPLAPSVVAGAPILAPLVPPTKQEERRQPRFRSSMVCFIADRGCPCSASHEDGYRISTSFSIQSRTTDRWRLHRATSSWTACGRRQPITGIPRCGNSVRALPGSALKLAS